MNEVLTRLTGLADSKWSGVAGSVAEIVGLDIRSTPGLIKVQQKLTRLSSFISPSASASASASPSASGSPSVSPSASRSPSASASGSPSASLSPSASASPSASVSLSVSPSASRSPSASASPSASSSPSASVSPSTAADDVDAFIKVAVAASNGYSFWFSSTTGKIWAIDSSDNVTLAYTTVPAAGGAGCLGAMEYNGYIYWVTESRLHRIAIADADAEWLNVSHNWATFGVTDDTFHPMAIQDLTLFIGDGNQVAQVDENGTFDNNVLDINTPYRIKSMIDYEFDLLLGTYIADNVNTAQIIRWDVVSPTWNTSDPINEAGINAFIRDDNNMLVNAGKVGNIYFYNGEQLETYRRVPGTYTNTATAVVHPGSVGAYNGIPIFGLSNGTGNPALEGIYSLGSYSRDYEKSMTLDWVNSEDTTSNVEMGAILVINGLIYAAYKSGTDFGIDQLDMTTKYASAYFTTRMLFQDKRNVVKSLAQVSAYYNSLPASTGLTFAYSINGGAFVDMTSVTNSLINEIYAKLSVPNIGSLQIKCSFTTSANTAPTVEMFRVEI